MEDQFRGEHARRTADVIETSGFITQSIRFERQDRATGVRFDVVHLDAWQTRQLVKHRRQRSRGGPDKQARDAESRHSRWRRIHDRQYGEKCPADAVIAVICGRVHPVQRPDPDLLAKVPVFQRVLSEDRARIGAVSQVRDYRRGDLVFDEGDPPSFFFIVLTGRVKVFKRTPDGHERILEIFGAGGLLGAVATYESRPFPAAAAAIEPATCLLTPSKDFFALLESQPSLVRGMLGSLSIRLMELTSRLAELTGGRVDTRFARLFLKLADQMGHPGRGGTFVPMALSRQELADLTGTTIETCIRIMSRWNKDNVLLTDKDGFVILDRASLEELASDGH